MSIVYQSLLTASPSTTTVNGPVTFRVDIAITASGLTMLDVDYIIVDSTNAVFFQNGGKIERHTVPVTGAQMTLNHPTQLVCGHGIQDMAGAQFLVAISSGGVLLAQPIGCGVGIAAYTCAVALKGLFGGSVMPHAVATHSFLPIGPGPIGVATSVVLGAKLAANDEAGRQRTNESASKVKNAGGIRADAPKRAAKKGKTHKRGKS
ncbi:MAG: hypothetical protein ABIP93_00520 [Gemmatimonadaceae bacterium]